MSGWRRSIDVEGVRATQHPKRLMRFAWGLAVTTMLFAARSATPSATDNDVRIRTFQFSPDTLAIRVGARVAWTNMDDIAHTVTSGTPDRRDSTFAHLLERRGATGAVTFERPGTYSYFCDRHQFMRGAIIVTR